MQDNSNNNQTSQKQNEDTSYDHTPFTPENAMPVPLKNPLTNPKITDAVETQPEKITATQEIPVSQSLKSSQNYIDSPEINESSPNPTPGSQISATQPSTPQIQQSSQHSNIIQPINPQLALNPTQTKKTVSKIIILLLTIITLIILISVAFLFYSNRNLKKEMSTASIAPTITLEPTPLPPSKEIMIENGNVVRKSQSGIKTTLVDRNDFSTLGITGFAKALVSPNEEMMCLEALPPAPNPALYVSDINATNVVLVENAASGCVWSPDSTKIVYTNYITDISQIDVFSYNLESKEIINLTKEFTTDGVVRTYENPVWSPNGNSITVSYSESNPNTSTNSTTGSIEITVLPSTKDASINSTPSATLVPTLTN